MEHRQFCPCSKCWERLERPYEVRVYNVRNGRWLALSSTVPVPVEQEEPRKERKPLAPRERVRGLSHEERRIIRQHKAQQISQEIARGTPVREIANLMGCTRAHIYALLHEL